MCQRQLFTSAVVNRPSDENNYQVQVGSFFKGDNFVRFMGDTFARGGSFHTFRLIPPDQSEYDISKGGPQYMGDRLFRDTGRGDSVRRGVGRLSGQQTSRGDDSVPSHLVTMIYYLIYVIYFMYYNNLSRTTCSVAGLGIIGIFNYIIL